MLDKNSEIDLFNYDTIDDAPLKASKSYHDPLNELDKILNKEENEKKTEFEAMVNVDTLDMVDKEKKEYRPIIEESNNEQIIKTKSSTIVKRKKPSFFDDENE